MWKNNGSQQQQQPGNNNPFLGRIISYDGSQPGASQQTQFNAYGLSIKEEVPRPSRETTPGDEEESFCGSAEGSGGGFESNVDSSTDRKKQVHLRCEQQRREAIKSGYADLKDLLPAEFAPQGCKMTNASILYRTVEYIQKLQEADKAQNEELAKLNSQLTALQIIYQNYEQLVVQSDSASQGDAHEQSVCQQKFKMFQELLECWFSTFDAHVQTGDYASLTASLLSWMEKETDIESVPGLLAQAAVNVSSYSNANAPSSSHYRM